jgi:acyl carrier protein
MQRSEIIEQLRTYIVQEILDGQDTGLDESTPLLEWGILNSLEIVRLLMFMQSQFDLSLALDQIVADQFADLRAIADLVLASVADQKT